MLYLQVENLRGLKQDHRLKIDGSSKSPSQAQKNPDSDFLKKKMKVKIDYKLTLTATTLTDLLGAILTPIEYLRSFNELLSIIIRQM